MKKLLGSTLALALLFPYSQANAELLKNFKLSGQIDLQATSADNVTDFKTDNYDQAGDAQTRVMLHMDWDLLDDVHANVSLGKNDRNYGQGTAAANAHGNTQSQTLGTAGAGNILGTVYVDQAYFKIDKLGGAVDATLGRQTYGSAGDLNVYYGPSDKALYGLPSNALDAVRLDWANDKVSVTGVVGKATGHVTGTTVSGDVDVRGITASCKEHEGMGAYLYEKVTHLSLTGGTGGMVGNDELWVAGLKGKLKLGEAWVKGELAKNFGKNRTYAGGVQTTDASYKGWALLLDAGMKADMGMAAVEPWAELGMGSGGDGASHAFAAVNSDYRPGSIYGRFSSAASGAAASLGSVSGVGTVSSNSLSDRVILGIGAKATPAALNRLTAGLSLWNFRYASGATAATGTPAAAAGDKRIGSEIDLDLTWKHSENVSIGAGVAEFFPGGAVRNAGTLTSGTHVAKLAYTDVRVRF